jgi:hypothetical protein
MLPMLDQKCGTCGTASKGVVADVHATLMYGVVSGLWQVSTAQHTICVSQAKACKTSRAMPYSPEAAVHCGMY